MAATEEDRADPAALMRTVLEAFAAKDIDGMRAMLHDDVVDDFVAIGIVEGKEAVGNFFSGLFAALPDMQLTIKRITRGDDGVAIGEWAYTGTFSGGRFQGLEPTGHRVELRGVDVMEFEKGLLRRNTIYYDGLGFARQVRLLPTEGSVMDRAMRSGFNALSRVRDGVRRTIERVRMGRVGGS
ncbi:nuclear transport factor 2 family protein [bacterium]|nr:nuclear transport factor 2 family protein [bacterium]